MNVFDFRKPRRSAMVSAFVMTVLAIASSALGQTSTLSDSYKQAGSFSQPSSIHYLHGDTRSPGLIGQSRLSRGGPVQGFYQPVSIQGPRGMKFSMAYGTTFLPLEAAPKTMGLLIGGVYRIRVTNLPIIGAEGIELYPTIEVIDRLYAPEGKAVEHPIIVYLALEDLELALKGKFVTRVVYLEDPNRPMPIVEPAQKNQGYTDVSPAVDPLAAADTMGRPVAIIRIGGRVPTYQNGQLSSEFLFGAPSFIDYQTQIPKPQVPITRAPNSTAAVLVPVPVNNVPVNNVMPSPSARTNNVNPNNVNPNNSEPDFFNP